MFIYVIVNTVNGKRYIGKTSNPDLNYYLHLRVCDALNGYRPNRPLNRAIREFGPDAFTIAPLHSGVNTNEELCQLEKEAIRLFDTRNSSIGYNVMPGGEGATPKKKRRPRTDAQKALQSKTMSKWWKARKEKLRLEAAAKAKKESKSNTQSTIPKMKPIGMFKGPTPPRPKGGV